MTPLPKHQKSKLWEKVKNKQIIFLFIWLAFFLTGCYPHPVCKSPDAVNWRKEMREIGNEVAAYLKHSYAPKVVIITDFVYLDDLKPHSFGLLLRNLLSSHLSKEGIKIKEAEFARYFKLTPEGFTLLTRNIKDIRQKELNEDITYAIIGTYEMRGCYIYLFTRIFNLKTNTVEKVIAHTVDLSGWQLTGYP